VTQTSTISGTISANYASCDEDGSGCYASFYYLMPVPAPASTANGLSHSSTNSPTGLTSPTGQRHPAGGRRAPGNMTREYLAANNMQTTISCGEWTGMMTSWTSPLFHQDQLTATLSEPTLSQCVEGGPGPSSITELAEEGSLKSYLERFEEPSQIAEAPVSVASVDSCATVIYEALLVMSARFLSTTCPMTASWIRSRRQLRCMSRNRSPAPPRRHGGDHAGPTG